MKTKTLKTICAFIIFSFTICINSSAQNTEPNWLLGGNTDNFPLISGLLSNSNYFGGTQTASLQFGTGGNTYMFIGGTIIPAYNGLVGIGNGFVTPAFQLDVSGITLPNGSLFRTTGNNTYDCDWEAWIQTGTGTPALYGRVYVPANTTDFAMEASTHNSNYPYQGNLQFYTSQLVGSPVLRMQINGPKEEHHQQGQIYNRTGYVGVNINPLSRVMPVSLLTLVLYFGSQMFI